MARWSMSKGFVCVFLTTCLTRLFCVVDFQKRCQPGLVWASTTMQWHGSWEYGSVSSWRLWHLTLVDLLPTLGFLRGGGDSVRFPQSSLVILRVFQLTLFVSEQKPLKSYEGTQEGRFGSSSSSPTGFSRKDVFFSPYTTKQEIKTTTFKEHLNIGGIN